MKAGVFQYAEPDWICYPLATPLTAGLVALIWSYDPTLAPDDVEDVLKQGCEDLKTILTGQPWPLTWGSG